MEPGYWQRRSQPRVTRRRFTAGFLALSAGSAAVLAGCGGGGSKNGQSNGASNGDASGTPGTTSPAASLSPSTPGKRGGTLSISGPSRHPSLDPADRVTHWPHLAKVYSHLLMYQASSGRVSLDAAVKVEQPDAETLRFTLRDGMTFHEGVAGGRAVTADDVAYSLNRIRQQATKPGTPLVNSQFNAIYWSWIEKVEATDGRTVVIHQSQPYASAQASLGALGFAIVAKEAVEAAGGLLKADAQGKDAGSGPYTLTKNDETGYTWERWPKYWKHQSPGPGFVEDGPYIDRIQWRLIESAAAAEAAFRAGEIDILGSVSGASSQVTWDKPKADELAKVAGVKVASAANPRTLIGQFDNYKWADVRLREAASLAIERDVLAREVYQGDAVFGAPIPAVFRDLSLTDVQLKQLQLFDPTRAKQLWAAAGGAAALPQIVMLTQAGTPLLVGLTNFIADQWRKNLGANVRVDAVDAATFVRRATDVSQPAKDWDFCITFESFFLTVPEANGLALYAPGGFGGNFGNLRTDVERTKELAKRLQNLHDAAARETNAVERKKKLDTLQTEHMKAFAPGIPIPMARLDYAAYRDTVKNFPVTDFQMGSASTNAVRVQDLWLDRA